MTLGFRKKNNNPTPNRFTRFVAAPPSRSSGGPSLPPGLVLAHWNCVVLGEVAQGFWDSCQMSQGPLRAIVMNDLDHLAGAQRQRLLPVERPIDLGRFEVIERHDLALVCNLWPGSCWRSCGWYGKMVYIDVAVSDNSAPQKCNLTMENDAARTRIIVCVFDITHLFTQQGLLISWAWTTATGLKKQMSLLQRFVEIIELACLICGWVGWLAAFSAGFWAVWTVGPLKKIGSYTLCSGPAAATVEHVSRKRLQRGWSYTVSQEPIPLKFPQVYREPHTKKKTKKRRTKLHVLLLKNCQSRVPS